MKVTVKKNLLALALGCASATSMAASVDASAIVNFEPYTAAKAEEVNQNFQAVVHAINATDEDVAVNTATLRNVLDDLNDIKASLDALGSRDIGNTCFYLEGFGQRTASYFEANDSPFGQDKAERLVSTISTAGWVRFNADGTGTIDMQVEEAQLVAAGDDPNQTGFASGDQNTFTDVTPITTQILWYDDAKLNGTGADFQVTSQSGADLSPFAIRVAPGAQSLTAMPMSMDERDEGDGVVRTMTQQVLVGSRRDCARYQANR